MSRSVAARFTIGWPRRRAWQSRWSTSCVMVLQSKVIHTDDTQVKLIDKSLRGTRLARYWAYIGDRGHPYIVYDFTDTRQREGPEKFLQASKVICRRIPGLMTTSM
ncbi:MAG: transposase [Pirellulaceae bacterium]